jgi:hypothetical protein
MGLAQRNKGKLGEREVVSLILKHTGVKLKRNQNQSDSGGYDIVADLSLLKTKEEKHTAIILDGFAIEVKNTADGFQPAYWKQAVQQADNYSREPLLFYKIPRRGFKIAVFIRSLLDQGSTKYLHNDEDIVHMEPVTFLRIIGLIK